MINYNLIKVICMVIACLSCFAFADNADLQTHVPSYSALEYKLGSFENIVRAKTNDEVKIWFDSSPLAYDTAHHAWDRVIKCTKNLADNLAIKIFGSVSHTHAVADNLIKYNEIAKYQVFSDESIAKQNKPVNPTETANKAHKLAMKLRDKHLNLYTKKLQKCVQTQHSLVKAGIKLDLSKHRRNGLNPNLGQLSVKIHDQVLADLEGIFETLHKGAQKVLKITAKEASARALATFIQEQAHGMTSSSFCTKTRACMQGGQCINGQCECPSSWSGPRCTDITDTCHLFNIKCEHQGVCQSHNGSFTCQCPDGFDGMYCERPLKWVEEAEKQDSNRELAAPTASKFKTVTLSQAKEMMAEGIFVPIPKQNPYASANNNPRFKELSNSGSYEQADLYN